MIHTGGCHCGAVGLEFESQSAAAELPVRECQCEFCRKHASRATTDPNGRLTIRASLPSALLRYRFGLETADFLICWHCGVYVAAISGEPTELTGIANINAFDDRAAFTSPPAPTDYSAETREARLARRRSTWTPARVDIGPG